jgi:nucleotide-binding universal stress UspA family protein
MAIATPSKIMLATDLTPAGDRAFDRAVQLAQQWDAELIVCHVIESSSMRPWGAERRVHNANTELERLVRASPLTGKLRRHIIIGDPAELVLQHAREIGCDLIVTGPAHGRVLEEKLLGSTAARIAAGQPAGPLSKTAARGSISRRRRGGRFLGRIARGRSAWPGNVPRMQTDRSARLSCFARLERRER